MDILYQNIDSYMRYKQHDNIVLIPIVQVDRDFTLKLLKVNTFYFFENKKHP